MSAKIEIALAKIRDYRDLREAAKKDIERGTPSISTYSNGSLCIEYKKEEKIDKYAETLTMSFLKDILIERSDELMREVEIRIGEALKKAEKEAKEAALLFGTGTRMVIEKEEE